MNIKKVGAKLAVACLILTLWFFYKFSSVEDNVDGLSMVQAKKQRDADVFNKYTKRKIQDIDIQNPWSPPASLLLKNASWRPLSNLVLSSEVGEGLELDEAQKLKLENWYTTFLREVSKLNTELTADVVDASGGTQLVYLKPDSKRWDELMGNIKPSLSGIIGENKANYFWNSCEMELDTLTGRMGREPRVFTIAKNGSYDPNLQVPQGFQRPSKYVVMLQSGQEAAEQASYFSTEVREALSSAANLRPSVTLTYHFDSPPIFLRSLFE